jgi:sodium transport system permease protein
MRWSIIRLIWKRDLLDQLRDRRTVLMIAVLPLLLYPLAGFGLVSLAGGFGPGKQVVGVYGADQLPPYAPEAAASWVALAPSAGPAAAAPLAEPRLAFPPLLAPVEGTNRFRLLPAYAGEDAPGPRLEFRALEADPDEAGAPGRGDVGALLAWRPKPLADREVDAVAVVPPGFGGRLAEGGRQTVYVLTRDDEASRAAGAHLAAALARWNNAVKEIRLARNGLPPDFDDPFDVTDPALAKPSAQRAAEDLFALLVRVFPFVMVMWSLAGALYPAVDLCAGEKERGTMETLLISPATREEIVYGKFLTIWVFSAGTALLNLLSMGFTAWVLGQGLHNLPTPAFPPVALAWCVLLVLPLSAFYSAVGLAVGAYARSSKEGQYYLMPLFLLTMPLIFITLAPGVELNPFYCMVPVTGVALLLQQLISPERAEGVPWLYFLPVLAPMVVYSWLALRWAVGQFRREEVLFREAERLDLGLWLRRLLREKEPLPTAGQALFCFAVVLALRWLSFGLGDQLSIGAAQLAFTAAPPLFMALLLTTRPRQGLALRAPPAWSWPAALCLAVLTVPPLFELVQTVRDQVPSLGKVIEQYNPLTGAEIQAAAAAGPPSFLQRVEYLLVLALLPAVCKELAFRGFILSGLSRRFPPWAAVILSAFLFALFQMNVFQFAPHFVFGVVLGLLVVRTGSVAPAMVLHFAFRALVLGPVIWPEVFPNPETAVWLPCSPGVRLTVAGVSAVLALALLAAMLWFGRRPLGGRWLSASRIIPADLRQKAAP